MNKKKMDIELYIKPIYGFVLSKTKNLHDAEDLSQDICLKILRAMQVKTSIKDMDKYVWSIAHNAVKNYYRKTTVAVVGLDQVSYDLISDDKSHDQGLIDAECIRRLEDEIAYLSSQQRKIIVLYYFSEIKQTDIARRLDIPLNTVKWHLREAKNSLKKGIKSMQVKHLKFNPICFDNLSLIGAVGSESPVNHQFKSALSQNIVYSIYDSAKTVHEISECLNVSPVFIEDELARLEELDFVLKKNDSYMSNLLMAINTSALSASMNHIYKSAAGLVANDLFDALKESALLSSPMVHNPHDINFLMWSLMPYVLSNTGDLSMDGEISFNEVATLLEDGSHFLAMASIHNQDAPLPDYYEEIKKNYGPLWNGKHGLLLWDMINKWVDRDIDVYAYSDVIHYDLDLIHKFIAGNDLSDEDYALLIQKGYCRRNNGEIDLALVHIKSKALTRDIVEIGNGVKKKHEKELSELKALYSSQVLDKVPNHLRKKQAFILQHIFGLDGMFNLYCIEALLESGRLQVPDEGQRKSLMQLLINEVS